MKKIISILLILVLALSMASCGAAQTTGGTSAEATSNTLQTILDRGYLIVGTGSNNPPWHFKDDKGVYQGFDVEMGRILAKALFKDETKVEFVEQTSDARIPNILSNKVDITIQFMTISPERAQQVAFSIPYYTEASALIMSAANSKYKSFEDLAAAEKAGETVRLGVLQNAFAEDIVREYLDKAVAEQFEEQAMVLQAVKSGVVDAGVIDLSNLQWEIKQHPADYVDSGQYAYAQNYGMAMRPDDQIWINFVNAVLLDSMTGASSQLYIDAYTKWFGENDQLSDPSVGMPKQFRNNNN